MGKIFKGALIGLASAVGAYYYKNPKDLEKHTKLVKENFSKVGEFIEEVKAELNSQGCKTNVEVTNQEENDIAREKLNELKAAYEEKTEEVEEIEIPEEAVEEVEPVIEVEEIEEITETEILIDEPVYEEEVVEPVVEVAGEVEETVEEVVEEAEEVDPRVKISEAVAQAKNNAKVDVEDNDEELQKEQQKTKTTLDSIVSLFASKDEDKK